MLAPPLATINRTHLPSVIDASCGLATKARVVSRYEVAINAHMATESEATAAKSENERMVSRPARKARILSPTARPKFSENKPRPLQTPPPPPPPAGPPPPRKPPAATVRSIPQ